MDLSGKPKGGGGEREVGGGQVELGVICVTVQLDVVLSNKVSIIVGFSSGERVLLEENVILKHVLMNSESGFPVETFQLPTFGFQLAKFSCKSVCRSF